MSGNHLSIVATYLPLAERATTHENLKAFTSTKQPLLKTVDSLNCYQSIPSTTYVHLYVSCGLQLYVSRTQGMTVRPRVALSLCRVMGLRDKSQAQVLVLGTSILFTAL